MTEPTGNAACCEWCGQPMRGPWMKADVGAGKVQWISRSGCAPCGLRPAWAKEQPEVPRE